MATPAVIDFNFQDKPVRCLGTAAEPWFVAKDVCDALGIVWKGMDTLDGILSEWRGVRNCRTPVVDQYGHQRFTMNDVIVIAEPAVYQLAARSKKPIAREFQRWLFAEVLPSIRKTGSYIAKKRERYVLAGKSEEWIDGRLEGVETRKGFTDTLHDHGVEKAGYGICTNAIYTPILGAGAGKMKARRGLKPRENLRDALTTRELLRVQFAEDLAAQKIEQDEAAGNDQCAGACAIAGEHVAKTIAVVTGKG